MTRSEATQGLTVPTANSSKRLSRIVAFWPKISVGSRPGRHHGQGEDDQGERDLGGACISDLEHVSRERART